MSARVLFERCVDSIEGALAAEREGADRIELCAALSEDGLSPSPGTLRLACARLRIPVMAMVRPRGGGFVYTEAELEAMEGDVDAAKGAGAAGVVFGVLRADDTIDPEATARLLQRARPLEVTFHRAFDRVPDPLSALDTLIALGVERVLTSGGAPTAAQGAEGLRALAERAAGRITILPGGGVRSENARALVESTGVRELHGSVRLEGL